jgi:hypothetical protein
MCCIVLRCASSCLPSQESRLPVISENCPACFEAPKERQRVKQLLASQELLVPNLYQSLSTAMLPLMAIDNCDGEGRHKSSTS